MGIFDQTKAIVQLKKLQKELQKTESVGSSPEDKVTAKVNGEFQLLEVSIDQSLLNQESKELLEKYIVMACSDAMSAAKKVAAEKMKGIGGLPDLGI